MENIPLAEPGVLLSVWHLFAQAGWVVKLVMIGLLAAIPAVIAYNKLSSDAGKIAVRMEGFADEFSAILSRQIDEKVAPKG